MNRIEFPRSKTFVPRQRDRVEPEFAKHSFALDVNVFRLIAIKTIEKQPVWTRYVPDGRHRRYSNGTTLRRKAVYQGNT